MRLCASLHMHPHKQPEPRLFCSATEDHTSQWTLASKHYQTESRERGQDPSCGFRVTPDDEAHSSPNDEGHSTSQLLDLQGSNNQKMRWNLFNRIELLPVLTAPLPPYPGEVSSTKARMWGSPGYQ